MKKLLRRFVFLAIVFLLFSSEGLPQNTQVDSVLISIDRIKIANLLIEERAYYIELYNKCTAISTIKDFTIVAQDSVADHLLTKIDNLNLIIDTKDCILDLEKDKLLALDKKHKRDKKFIIGGAGALLLLLILL